MLRLIIYALSWALQPLSQIGVKEYWQPAVVVACDTSAPCAVTVKEVATEFAAPSRWARRRVFMVACAAVASPLAAPGRLASVHGGLIVLGKAPSELREDELREYEAAAGVKP